MPPTTVRLEYIICVQFRACLLLMEMHYFLYYITVRVVVYVKMRVLTLKPFFSHQIKSKSPPPMTWTLMILYDIIYSSKTCNRNRLPVKAQWLFRQELVCVPVNVTALYTNSQEI